MSSIKTIHRLVPKFGQISEVKDLPKSTVHTPENVERARESSTVTRDLY